MPWAQVRRVLSPVKVLAWNLLLGSLAATDISARRNECGRDMSGGGEGEPAFTGESGGRLSPVKVFR